MLSVFIKSLVWSVLPPVFRYRAHPTELMVQLHKASLVEPNCHSKKVLDFLDLTISRDLIRE